MKFINETDCKIIIKDSKKRNKALKYKIPFDTFKIKLINIFILATKNEDKSCVYKCEKNYLKNAKNFLSI